MFCCVFSVSLCLCFVKMSGITPSNVWWISFAELFSNPHWTSLVSVCVDLLFCFISSFVILFDEVEDLSTFGPSSSLHPELGARHMMTHFLNAVCLKLPQSVFVFSSNFDWLISWIILHLDWLLNVGVFPSSLPSVEEGKCFIIPSIPISRFPLYHPLLVWPW